MDLNAKTMLIAAAALAAAATASPAAAAVTVLDFPTTSCVTFTCSNGSIIQATYGDGEGVDVQYASFVQPSGDLFSSDLRYWAGGYGDLVGVVWGGGNTVNFSSRITLVALEGYEISLRGFDIATFARSSATSPVRIESLGGLGILSETVSTMIPTHNHVEVNSAYFRDGIALNWGPDGFNVGLDNITFDVRAITPDVGGIPEPQSWALMILGFGAAGAVVRRRRAQIA